MKHYSAVSDLVFYKTLGVGKPMVMLHGYLLRGEMFDPLIPFLANDYELIIPDLRGYGLSQTLPAPFTVQKMAEDVVQLLHHLNLQQVIMLGYSMGGLVAQYLTFHYPERVSRLILSNTFSYKSLTPLERMQGSLMNGVVKRLGAQGLARWMTGGIARMAGKVDDNTLRWYRNMIADNRDDVILASAKSIFDFDSRPYLKQLRKPTLIFGGQEDIVVPVHHSKFLCGQIQGSRLRIYDTGHGLPHTHTQQFIQDINEFMKY